MSKHYEIKGNKIMADVLKLTDKEAEEVRKYQSFGLELVVIVPEDKQPVKRLDDKYIKQYLANDGAALATYEGKKNETIKDENGEVKYREKNDGTKGAAYKAGFNAGRNWFAITYPLDAKEAYQKIEAAGLKSAAEKAFADYEDKNNAKMTKDQYMRDYYWKNVFVRE